MRCRIYTHTTPRPEQCLTHDLWDLVPFSRKTCMLVGQSVDQGTLVRSHPSTRAVSSIRIRSPVCRIGARAVPMEGVLAVFVPYLALHTMASNWSLLIGGMIWSDLFFLPSRGSPAELKHFCMEPKWSYHLWKTECPQ